MKTRYHTIVLLLLLMLGLNGCRSGGEQPSANVGEAQVGAASPQTNGPGEGSPGGQAGAPHDAAGFVALGSELYKKDCDAEAVEAFQQAITLDPENGEAQRRLGLAYASLGQREEADEAFEKAIDLFEKKVRRDSKDADTLFQLADAYSKTGEYEKAADAYRKAAKLREPDGGTYYDMGLVYNKLAKYKEAADAFGKAVELDPNDYRAQEAFDEAKEDASKQRERIDYQKKMLEKQARGGNANNANNANNSDNANTATRNSTNRRPGNKNR